MTPCGQKSHLHFYIPIAEPKTGSLNLYTIDHDWLHNLHDLVQNKNTEFLCSKVTKNFNMATAEH